MRIMATATSGVRAQQLAIDTAADNLANINTTGFKSHQVDFAAALAPQTSDYVLAVAGQEKEPNQPKLNIGSGVTARDSILNLDQGALVETTSPWDLAIEGNGFFQMQTANGQVAYTRAGDFRLDYLTDSGGQKTGRLVDSLGNILKTTLPLQIPYKAANVTVSPDGRVTGLDDKGKAQEFGQINLAQFSAPDRLRAIGDNLYTYPDGAGTITEVKPGSYQSGMIRPQTREQSNTELTTVMAELVQAQRAYQLNIRMIKNGDEMWEMANSLRR